MADLSQLSIIIVNWNVRELLRACLAALPCEAEIIVVDNASTDGSAEMVRRDFSHVRLLANSENRGFTGGNNDGLKVATRPWVLFLNPDTLVQGDALGQLLAYLQSHAAVGVVGPQLRYGDGSLQSSRRRFPTFATALLESTPLAWHLPLHRNPWARRYHMADVPASRVQEVDWLVGAALLTRQDVLAEVGWFDEGYFMYSEELDWQRRVKQIGWKIVYLAEAVITHYEGKSSEQASGARHIHFNRSKVRYFRKHHGPRQGEVLRLALLLMYGLEWAVEAAKFALGSERAMRRGRLGAYARLIRSGLLK
jgi:GT2 family glycosyltransferase